MSDDTAALTATMKAGGGYDAPWLVVRGDSPDDMTMKLNGLTEVIASLVSAADSLKTVYNIGAGSTEIPAQQGPPPAFVNQAPPVQQAWGQGAPQQQNQPPAQQGGGNKFGGPTHPEGKSCLACGTVLERKTTGTGKSKWQCPQWRWNNGNPNGHDMEWIN